MEIVAIARRVRFDPEDLYLAVCKVMEAMDSRADFVAGHKQLLAVADAARKKHRR